MKILLVNSYLHHKNLHSITSYKNVELKIVKTLEEIEGDDLSSYDCVYSPSLPIDVKKNPESIFIFGPHFSIFPDERINMIKSKNSIFILPSQWCIDFWKNYEICRDLEMKVLTFGVDTEKFNKIKPIENRDRVFIYYKGRTPQELNFIENILSVNNIEYRVFSYRNSYDENEYIEYLQNAKYGIWLDAHESQGFALQEALSCDVPLCVWSVTSMNQEYGQNYPDIAATTIPYWDERCGEVFYDVSEFGEKINTLLSKIDVYKPREFILEKLSMDVCEQQLIKAIDELKQL